jgi:hypothetical protein
MPPAPRHPDRRSADELVEELREDAADLERDLKGIPAHETAYGEAAQTLEEYSAALSQIAAGTQDPKAVATEALSLAKPLAPIGDAIDPIRELLKPRTT